MSVIKFEKDDPTLKGMQAQIAQLVADTQRLECEQSVKNREVVELQNKLDITAECCLKLTTSNKSMKEKLGRLETWAKGMESGYEDEMKALHTKIAGLEERLENMKIEHGKELERVKREFQEQLQEAAAVSDPPPPPPTRVPDSVLIHGIINGMFPRRSLPMIDETVRENNAVESAWSLVFKIENRTGDKALKNFQFGNVSPHSWRRFDRQIGPRRKNRFSFGAISRQGLYESFRFDIAGTELCLVMVVRLAHQQFAIGLIPQDALTPVDSLEKLFLQVSENTWPRHNGECKMQGRADQDELGVSQGNVNVKATLNIQSETGNQSGVATFFIDLDEIGVELFDQ